MGWNAVYTEFNAADAERITGIDGLKQRDLRRQGYLPPLEAGRAKYDAKLLAGMLAFQALSNAGVPPQYGWQIARSCSAVIAARVLNAGRGVYDPHLLLNEPLIRTGPAAPEQIRWMVTNDRGQTWGWARTADELAEHMGAASVVLDLDVLGDQLVSRARAILVLIEPEAA